MKLGRLTAALALVVTAACASAPAGGTQSQSQLDVRITNNLIPPRTLTVFLVPRAGIERSIGDIIGSGTQVLRYRGLPLQGEYQLVARVSGTNAAVLSSVLVLDKVRSIEWDLQRNYIQVTAVDE